MLFNKLGNIIGAENVAVTKTEKNNNNHFIMKFISIIMGERDSKDQEALLLNIE